MLRRIDRVLRRVFALDGLAAPENRVAAYAAVVLAAAAMALRLFFWLYTGRLWEDALITTLHSENFWSGLGLTHFRPGDPPLHGFTSPLSVLIPMVGDAFHVGWGVEFLKLVSIPAGALAVFYAFGIVTHPTVRLPAPVAILPMGYLAVEHHQILWGMSGMETQVVTTILLMSIYFLIARKTVALGVALGLCMLARPDFAFWTIVAGLYVLIRSPRRFPLTVATASAVYAPWIVFTTLYYGSPLPNTIRAKGTGYGYWWMSPNLDWTVAKRDLIDRASGSYMFNTIFQPLGPCFGGHGTSFRAVIQDGGLICNTMIMLLLLGTLVAVVRRQWVLWPVIGFVITYAVYYLFFVPYVFGWYIVPFVAVAILLSTRGIAAVANLIPAKRLRALTAAAAVFAYLGAMAWILPLTFKTERLIQQEIENKVRKELGLYLGQVMRPDQWVACEPLGYVGYFSRRPVYDFPGLANRRVVEFTRAHPEQRSLHGIIRHFAPDYVALRPQEYNGMDSDMRLWFDASYTWDHTFQAPETVKKDVFLWYTNIDLVFHVFKRRPPLQVSTSNTPAPSATRN